MPLGIIQAFDGSSRQTCVVKGCKPQSAETKHGIPAEPLTPCSVLWGSDSTSLTLNVLCRDHLAWALCLGKLPVFQ